MNTLIEELKINIIEALQLEDIKPEDISEDEPLVGGNLGIDSVDILELVMMIEENYTLLIDNKDLGTKVFASVRALADFIQENMQKQTEKKR